MPEENSLPSSRVLDKFYELHDDLEAMRTIYHRVFFEFLRTKPTLTVEEIDNIWAISDLLADLSKEKQRLTK